MAPYNAEDGCRLFVYGVAEGTSNGDIQAEFDKYGPVVDTYNTGKGYAFVTFERKEDAEEATKELNGANVCGQQIKVDVAKGRSSGGRGGGSGRGRGWGSGYNRDSGGRREYRGGKDGYDDGNYRDTRGYNRNDGGQGWYSSKAANS